MNETQRATPKEIALKRLTRLADIAHKTCAQLRGFEDDASPSAGDIVNRIEDLFVHIDRLPDDFKPKRKRAGKEIKVGAAYQIKDKHAARYAKVAGGDASICIVDAVLGDDVRVLFESGTKAIVKRTHLGNEIEEEN